MTKAKKYLLLAFVGLCASILVRVIPVIWYKGVIFTSILSYALLLLCILLLYHAWKHFIDSEYMQKFGYDYFMGVFVTQLSTLVEKDRQYNSFEEEGEDEYEEDDKEEVEEEITAPVARAKLEIEDWIRSLVGLSDEEIRYEYARVNNGAPLSDLALSELKAKIQLSNLKPLVINDVTVIEEVW